MNADTICSPAACHTLSLSKCVDPPKGPVLLNYGIEKYTPYRQTGADNEKVEPVGLATILTKGKKLD